MVKLVKSSLMGGRGNIFSKLQTFLSQAKNGRHHPQKILNIMTRHFFFTFLELDNSPYSLLLYGGKKQLGHFAKYFLSWSIKERHTYIHCEYCWFNLNYPLISVQIFCGKVG